MLKNIIRQYKINNHVEISYTIYSPNFDKVLIYVIADYNRLDWPLELHVHRFERNQWYRTLNYDVYLSMFYTFPKEDYPGTLWIDNFLFNKHGCQDTLSFTKRCILVWGVDGKVLDTSKYVCALHMLSIFV